MTYDPNYTYTPDEYRERIAALEELVAEAHIRCQENTSGMLNFQRDTYEEKLTALRSELARTKQELASVQPSDKYISQCVDTACALFQEKIDAMQSELAESNTTIEALNQKLKSLAPHGTCGCSYDSPTDLCMHHSPQVTKLKQELAEEKKLTAQQAEIVSRQAEWIAAKETLAAEMMRARESEAALQSALSRKKARSAVTPPIITSHVRAARCKR